MKWAVLALAGIGAYFVIERWWLDVLSDLDRQATAREAELASLRSRANVSSGAGAEVAAGVARYGVVREPVDAQTGANSISKRLGQVLGERGVKQYTATTRAPALLPSGPLSPAGAIDRVERLVTDVQFEASPETFTAVLADLEQSPEVSSVSRVQVQRGGSAGPNANARIVRVNLSVETWVKSTRSGASSTRASVGTEGLP